MTVVGVRAVAVVVPAHDERALVGDCLASLAAARQRLRRVRPDVSCLVHVVLDDCRDGTGAVVARTPDVGVSTVVARNVGTARAAGVDAVRDLVGPVDPRTVWLACTDADTVVPSAWLVQQVALAEAGWDAVVGTVSPTGLPRRVLHEWRRRHRLVEDHAHVHGANLGVRLSAYDAIGGFAPLPVHEDVNLVTSLRDNGFRCLATDSTRVLTSGRSRGRTPGGFAGYVALLR